MSSSDEQRGSTATRPAVEQAEALVSRFEADAVAAIKTALATAVETAEDVWAEAQALVQSRKARE